MPSDSPQPANDSAPAAASGTADAKPAKQEGSIKETIESILVAFILAFVFRAFVVEAFVIPTGSMAPTLLGAHMRYFCPDCGWRWTVNYSSGGGEDVDIPNTYAVRETDPSTGQTRLVAADVLLPIYCPNCGMPVRRQDEKNPDNTLTGPPVYYGDRILVLKYLYLFQEPKRWDVVVFKNPSGKQVPTAPELHFSMNYIKRLIGVPGDSVMILYGDIYVGPKDADPLTEPEKFKIQRKPWDAQQALWRNVYHNDYLPHLPDDQRLRPGETGTLRFQHRYEKNNETVGRPWQQPWKQPAETKAWTLGPAGRSRVFSFNDLAGTAPLEFDPKANPDSEAFTDHVAYDSIEERAQGRVANNVNDIKLGLVYTRQEGDGPLDLELTRLDHQFTARITRGKVEILHTSKGQTKTIAGPTDVSALSGSSPANIDFYNVDYRAGVRVNDVEVLTADYDPDVAGLVRDWQQQTRQPMPTVRIVPSKQKASFEHVTLDRDVYYLNWTNFKGWGDPDSPIRLGPDEFWVLGDNSFISGDARTWRSRDMDIELPDENLYLEAGRVPRRFMLGKAFFVYWPAGYRPFKSAPGLVPNFGEMRFIH